MALKVGELFAEIGLKDSGYEKGLAGAEKAMNKASKGMLLAGGAMTAALTVPLVKLGKAIFNIGVEFDSAMSEVAAVSGATGEQFDALREMAQELGGTTAFTAAEAAEGMKYMGMAGWETEEILAGIPAVLDLAAASGEDLATTSDIVTDALTALGMSADETGRFADVLAAASANSNTNVAIMGESFKYAAAMAGTLGYSAEDMALSLGLMANAGIKGSMAGTQLRNVFNALASPSKKQAKAFQRLGVETTNADGSMRPLRDVLVDMRGAFGELSEAQQTQMAQTIAGTRGMAGLLAIMNASEDDFNSLAESIDNSSGAARNMAEIMLDNVGGSMTKLKSALGQSALRVWDVFSGKIKDVVDGLTSAVTWFNGLDDSVMEFVGTAGAVLASLGPILLALAGIKKLGNVFGGLMAIVKSPVGLALAGIAAALTVLYNTCEPVRKAIDGIKTAFKVFFEALGNGDTAIDAIKKALNEGFGEGAFDAVAGAVETVTAAFHALAEWASAAWTNMKEAFSQGNEEGGLGAGIMAAIMSLESDIWAAIQSVDWGAIWSKVMGYITNFAQWLPEGAFDAGVFIGQIAAGLAGIGGQIIDAIKTSLAGEGGEFGAGDFLNAIGMTLSWFGDVALSIINGIATGFVGHPVDVGEWLSSIKEGFEQWVTDTIAWFQENFTLEKLWEAITATPEVEFEIPEGMTEDQAKNYATAMAANAARQGMNEDQVSQVYKEALQAAMTKAQEGLVVDTTGAQAAGQQVGEAAATGIENGTGDWTGVGRNAVQGLANGISEYEDKAVNAARAVGAAAAAALNAALRVGSPSKVTAETGRYFAQGFANGIMSGMKGASSAAGAIASSAARSLVGPSYGGAAMASAGIGGGGRIDYRLMAAFIADAVSTRPTILNVGGRNLAEATARDNSNAINAYQARVQRGYGR